MIRTIFLCLLCSFVWADHPPLLKPQTEERIREVIQEEVPDLPMESITIISSGWDNLVADVNGEWIFRFPKHKDMQRKLPREFLLLEKIRPAISLPIPDFQIRGTYTCFAACPKFEGAKLSGRVYRSLPSEKQQLVASGLAQFVSELHQAISPEEARQLGYRNFDLPLKWIRARACGTFANKKINAMVDEALKVLESVDTAAEDRYLIHNDLHGDNFFYDPNTTQISGIIDFSDAGIGHPATEFSKLIQIDPDLMVRALREYGREDLVVRAAAEHIVCRCLYLIDCRKRNDQPRKAILMGQLYRFLPFWNEVYPR